MQKSFLKRASLIGALFFCASPLLAKDLCSSLSEPDWRKVKHVHDGDSLQLADRRKIRLIGVNTPELARDERAAEPYAREARSLVIKLIRQAHWRVGLIYGPQRKDRYGRTLAHVFLPDGSNLSERLLLNGLGSHIAITPNLGYLDCYKQAQLQARKQQQNLWQPGHTMIIDLQKSGQVSGGFHHVRGKVTRVAQGNTNIWINFGDALAIRILREDLHYFTQWRPKTLEGKVIEASGWVYTAKGNRRMRIHHPSIIQVLENAH